MTVEAVEVQRPDRWSHPLSSSMTDESLRWLLKQIPFRAMDTARFARHTPLVDILRNDTRLLALNAGDVVFQQGQYGGTAYLVLDGDVRIFLSRLLPGGPQVGQRRRLKWLEAWGRKWERVRRSLGGRSVESRKKPRSNLQSGGEETAEFGYRGEGADTRIFLQDIPGVLSRHATSAVRAGELFGEMAAVTRSPREFTAVAENPCALLEIRWQGLKLLKQDPAFRQLLDERYRSEVLRTHLRETPLFRFIPEENIEQIAAAARLESFGNLEWYAEYRKHVDQTPARRIEGEPLIAEEGAYATGLWIIRGGFARLSRRQGVGHRTLSYLGKGQMYGWRELAHNYRGQATQTPPLPFQESLRAIGYVDALCIPKQIVNEHVLPFVRAADLPSPIVEPRYQYGQPVVDAPLDMNSHAVETGLLEFLVDERLMNGHQTMVIDMDRCTRCDDCVRACATTHGGTPVFVREGPQYGPWMFAHACMHCEDPVCMIGCPTGAIHRDHASGLVNINENTCIGCKSCAESCPYDNIRMIASSDDRGRACIDQANGLPILQASKCDLCSSTGSRKPACQSACPHDALVRLDMSDLTKLSQWMERKVMQ